MKTVSLQEATRDLEALADAVEQGEVVTVTRDGRPVLDLVPHAGTAAEEAEQRGKGIDWEAGEAYLRSRGIVRGPGFIAEDFDDPLPEDFLLRPLP
ncbi:MAG: type II toxin-antitoxin system Phd/YefM family antitoxin [Agrobacterium albertimagni]|uniref:Type II toxin-antitoxin system prevent-host-death family antitoxin n=1 Tax=Rhizobium rhizophilum TaxID=1850373 RepID=A0ABY2QXL0_9HYPH|nr:type II toxin-antitoxin system prevent-host-death family antitoxin [Rhizobium rhizophilum]THV15695.1 type II toxin-antitoxin system prevent-host-death family antitoxin [Rhizobium rhizophilum]